MDEKKLLLNKSKGYGTFFQFSGRSTYDFSSSLLLSLFKVFSYCLLIQLVSGEEISNSFAFLQNATYYLLKTKLLGPGAAEEGYQWTLKAYKSVIKTLLSGELGAVVQSQDYQVQTVEIWSTEACISSLELSSNGTQTNVENFLIDFVDMVKNDSAFIEAKKFCASMNFDLKLAAIFFGAMILILTIATIIGLFCLNRANRNSYQSIRETSQPMEEIDHSTPLKVFFTPG